MAVIAGWWWHTPSISAFERQGQGDLREFQANLVCRSSSRTVRAIIQRNPESKQTNRKV